WGESSLDPQPMCLPRDLTCRDARGWCRSARGRLDTSSREGDEIYTAVLPPSTGRIAPWTKLARSVARNIIASAISSGVAGRPAGACAASCCSASPIAAVPSVRVGPGLTALTRTPLRPYSAAHALVSRLMAALLEPYRLMPAAP